MKNIYSTRKATLSSTFLPPAWLAVCLFTLSLLLAGPAAAPAQGDPEGFPGETLERRLDKAYERQQGQAEDEGREESYIGTDEQGDSVMRTAPARPRSGGVGHYEDGLIIAPQIEPIIPLQPRPRQPFNPYPGPGPHPGPQPRHGINQLHEYNYNPEYPQEVPRRHRPHP